MTDVSTRGPAPTGDVDVSGELAALGLEVDASSRRRAEYSYDASNYRIRPIAVVFPHTDVDVARTAAYCHAHGIPLIARGGGTSMGGNAIGTGQEAAQSGRDLGCNPAAYGKAHHLDAG